jgi:diadenylate cyclase
VRPMTGRKEWLDLLKLLAPGSLLREGLDNMLHARTGALIVLGSKKVETIMDGGFKVDAPLTPSSIYELAKMDGAIVLNSRATRLLMANVHLNPDPRTPSRETGIRHRIAERVSRQTGCAVISISQRRNVITLYLGEEKYVLQDLSILLVKVSQALQTLEKHKNVLDQALVNLSALEFENLVTLEEVISVLQRSEMVLRIAGIVEQYIVELGSEGHLIGMQLEELLGNLTEEQDLVLRDYQVRDRQEEKEKILRRLAESSDEELLDPVHMGTLLGYREEDCRLGEAVQPRGYRLLGKIPRLPRGVADHVAREFGTLQDLAAASPERLNQVEGIGEVRARTISRGLKRLREQCLLEKRV